MVNRPRLLHRFALLAAVPLVLAAGCSSKQADSGIPSLNGQSSSGEATTTTTVDVEKAVGKFVTCLRDQGLDVADPKVDSNGRVDMRSIFESSNIQPGSTEFRTVMDKCGSLLRDAGFGPSAGDQKQRQEAMLKYTACLRKEGLDVGDLTFGGPGGDGPGGPPGAPGAPSDNGSSTTVAGGTSGSSTTVAAAPERPDFPRTQAERNARMAERLGVDINDPEVAKAFSACESVLSSLRPPGGGPGGGPGGPSTTQG